jgi:dipeptidyl-peptidase-4
MARFRRTRTSRDPRIVRPSRGHQYMVERSPDSTYYALCEGWNMVLEHIKTGEKTPVTTSGTRKYRFGTADWVWGEELNVLHGMWWTPDSKKLIYYVFDERPVRDFYLAGAWTDVITSNLVEGYTKAGDPNAKASLEIYDLVTGLRTPIDVGECAYIFDMRFTPDGKEFLFNRTDRHHRHLEVVAMDIETLKMRVVVEERQKTWQDNHPTMRFLEDGKRFIWQTEKTGFYQYELRHLNGKLLATLTRGNYPASRIEKVDEANGYLYYTAASDLKNPLDSHLHRVTLKGKNQKKLTIKPLNHSGFSFSPDMKYFTARYESIATPPSTGLFTTSGRLVKVLAQGPDVKNERSELFTFKAVDGMTDVYGVLHKPKDLDPNKKYPVIVSVYGGPASRAFRNTFRSDTWWYRSTTGARPAGARRSRIWYTANWAMWTFRIRRTAYVTCVSAPM